ncbi:MAG: stage II sporulation protein P [Oscillospiraceae bacterium]|nr:stage II sporulation protein P [Oscillospiraceae bacterium]
MAKGFRRLLRRSTALALALTGAWVVLRTAGATEASQALQALSQDTSFVLSLLRQLPATSRLLPYQDGLTPRERLVIAQSPLLHQTGRVMALSHSQSHPPAAAPEPDRSDEDLAEPELTEQSHAPVIPRTFVPSEAQSYLQTGDLYVADRAKKQPDISHLSQQPVGFSLTEGPHVLILHSHATEAYTPEGEDVYTPSDPYRTTDCNYNTVRVGEEIARTLRSHGLEVIHDTTLYDYPSYNEAYDRSLAAAQRWLAQYPTIQVVLDVHRDALVGEDESIYKAISVENGQQAAQVMLVVGTDGTDKYHPLWQENLTFALHLQRQLLDDHETLARPMVLRASRFNQHLRTGSLLVEVGTHGNTLEEALLGARLFAESAGKTLKTLIK